MKMIRNLKVMGLALVAVFAMSAVAASAASAAPGLTGPAGITSLTATDAAATFTTAGGTKVVCHATYTVPTALPASELTVNPDYKECKALTSGGTELGPATVTMNGCDFDLFIETNPANTFSAKGKITCTGANKIEIHVYSNSTHATNICTFTISPQEDLTGGKATNNGNRVKLEGNVAGVKVTRDNLLCGGTVEQTATQSLGGELIAKNAEETELNLDLTE